MPLRLDIKRQLSARSDRVKCVDMHPSEPWMLASLYNGTVQVGSLFQKLQKRTGGNSCALRVSQHIILYNPAWGTREIVVLYASQSSNPRICPSLHCPAAARDLPPSRAGGERAVEKYSCWHIISSLIFVSTVSFDLRIATHFISAVVLCPSHIMCMCV